MPVRAALVSAPGRLLRFGARTRAVNPAAVRSIVVIKPCCLGDLLLATPALAALRAAYPHASISLAVSAWARPAVENNPHIDTIVDCEGFTGRHWRRWSAYRRFSKTLRAGAYDLAIVLDRSLFASLAAWRAGIPLRVGIDSGGRGFSLTTRVPWNQIRHETDLYLDVVRAGGAPVSVAEQPFYRPAPVHRTFAARVFEEWALRDRGPVVVIHPGGGSNPGMKLAAKRWPAGRYAALADRLVDSIGAQVVVVGHPEDAPVARQLHMAMQFEAAGPRRSDLVRPARRRDRAQRPLYRERCRRHALGRSGRHARHRDLRPDQPGRVRAARRSRRCAIPHRRLPDARAPRAWRRERLSRLPVRQGRHR